jgi:hypothetical protein
MKNALFWEVAPCGSCKSRRFGGTCHLHLQGSNLVNVYIFSLSRIFSTLKMEVDRLCVLVVRVPGYRSRGAGSIPGATGFSDT